MNKENYEWFKLPSKGQCYPIDSPLRIGKVKLLYLTALDESIITSMRINKKDNIIDEILKRKIVDKDIDVLSLCNADREAIALRLRCNGYNDKLTLTLKTQEDEAFETSVNIDWNDVHYSDFRLIGDDNGMFMYFTKDGDILKFRYLTERKIEEINEAFEKDDTIKDYETFLKSTLKVFTYSVNDNTDTDYINRYIDNMLLNNASLYRMFIIENMPKVYFKIKIGKENKKETVIQPLIDDSIFLQ